MTEMTKPKLYVGCALTHSPDEFRSQVELVKQQLAQEWDVMHFIGLIDGDVADVYQRDIEENIRRCDAFIAIADYPATGLGWELGVADERRIPTMIVAKRNASITRLVIGAAQSRHHFAFRFYDDIQDIPAIAHQTLLPILNVTMKETEVR